MQDNTLIHFSGIEIIRDENIILTDAYLKINKGEFAYLIGKVGSGKSSLLKSIYGELAISKGEARVIDFDLKNIKSKQLPYLRRKLGIVFQDFQLLTDRTVDKNLEFVLKATGWSNKQQIKQRIESVLQQVGMQTKGYKKPHELSGGEQQRIVIARALLNEPEIILADEPTGNLDPETGETIIRLLHDISKRGTAVLMSTHNYLLVEKYPARIIKCENQSVREV